MAMRPGDHIEPGAGGHGRRLLEVTLLFLKLGVIGFGGPAAHAALMEEEVVRRKRWLTREEFMDLLGATHLIPGPNSTELAIHIGRRQAGLAGLVMAGVAFILPAMAISLGCAWMYIRYGTLPQAMGVLYGVKAVIMAVVIHALWRLAQTAAKTKLLIALGVTVGVLSFLGVHELGVLFGAGMLMALGCWIKSNRKGIVPGLCLPWMCSGAVAGVAMPVSFGLWPLFLFFLKVGSVLFGSGYVLLAFLRADLVERWQWLSEAQLLDAIAVGQVTPGPVFTTATFIGYILGGWPGAMVATAGIFLPAFVFVWLSAPLIPRLRNSVTAAAFLDGVNVASLALMAVVTVYLGRAALVDWQTIGLACLSGVLLIRFRVNSAWLVIGGAVVGYLLKGG